MLRERVFSGLFSTVSFSMSATPTATLNGLCLNPGLGEPVAVEAGLSVPGNGLLGRLSLSCFNRLSLLSLLSKCMSSGIHDGSLYPLFFRLGTGLLSGIV